MHIYAPTVTCTVHSLRTGRYTDFEGLTNRSTGGKFRLPFLQFFYETHVILGGLRDKNFKFRCIYVPTRLDILPVTQHRIHCLLGCSKKEMPPMVDLDCKHFFSHSFENQPVVSKQHRHGHAQALVFMKSFINF